MPDLLPAIEIETGKNPVYAVIWLHGLGADGSDFVPVVPELGLGSPPAVRFVFPHAPVRPVTLNSGMPMRAWYDILGPGGKFGEDEPGLRQSAAAVQVLLDREAARGIAPSRTVLMGFSQGCAMTLLTGLRAPQRLAGLVGLSGYLPLAATTAAERSVANRDTPVFLAHGRFDPMVALARGTATRDALVALGQPVQWHDYPMEHEVSNEEIGDIGAWLRERL